MPRRPRVVNSGWGGGAVAGATIDVLRSLLSGEVVEPSRLAALSAAGAFAGMAGQRFVNTVMLWRPAHIEVVRKTINDIEHHSLLHASWALRLASRKVLRGIINANGDKLRPHDSGLRGKYLSRLQFGNEFHGEIGIDVMHHLRRWIARNGAIRINSLATRCALTALIRQADKIISRAIGRNAIVIDGGGGNGFDQVKSICRNVSSLDFCIVGDADLFSYSGEFGGDRMHWLMPVIGKSQALFISPVTAESRMKLFVAEGSSAAHEVLLGSHRLQQLKSRTRTLELGIVNLGSVTRSLSSLSRGEGILAWDNNRYSAVFDESVEIIDDGGPLVANSLYASDEVIGDPDFANGFQKLIIAAWSRVRRHPLMCAIAMASNFSGVDEFHEAVKSG